MDEEKIRTVNGDEQSPPLHSVGGLVQSGGYMKMSEIESAQRQDGAEMATEKVARRHATTGNGIGVVGYHAGPGAKNIYDSNIVGAIPAGGGLRKHARD